MARKSRKFMVAREELPSLLERLLALPTTTFHERFVSSFLSEELKKSGLDFHLDRYGNLIAGSPDGKSPIAFIAHMDHPGFEITDAGNGWAKARWFGGVDSGLFAGTRVVIYDQSTGALRARGVVEKIHPNGQGRVETMELRAKGTTTPGDFGSWDLVPFRFREGRIHTKGADDLVGCAAILSALREVQARRIPAHIVGVFTRAEEHGFLGTLGMIRQRILSPATRIVSVETSKALPGAALGGGPVIRLGDRTSLFHPDMALFMDHVARELKRREPDFAYQRRIMDGGTCEATPYQLNGHPAGGVAVPLHNYHNQGRKRIAPEAVHLADVAATVRFLVEIAAREAEFHQPREELLRRWQASWTQHEERLLPKRGELK
jgi:endoglucanase